MIDEEKTGVHEDAVSGKRITKDGHIVAQTKESVFQQKGFRPGMKALRDMKMHWTMNEFAALDAQFEYKIKAQKEHEFKIVSIDTNSIASFQQYVRNFDFQVTRLFVCVQFVMYWMCDFFAR